MSRARVAIRPKAPSDDPSVLDLARSLPKWFTEQGVREIAEDVKTHRGFVAVSGGEVVGFVTWAETGPGIANLSWMAVRESLRHTGIGTRLLAALEKELPPQGYRILEVSTVADSVEYAPYSETRRFYRSRGFVEHRLDAKFFGEGEDRYDRLFLRKTLIGLLQRWRNRRTLTPAPRWPGRPRRARRYGRDSRASPRLP